MIPHALVVAGRGVVSGLTRRPAVTLLLSANDEPFVLALPGRPAVRAQGMLVAPGQCRSLQAEDCELLSINVEPGHERYGLLLHSLGGACAVRVASRGVQALHDPLRLAWLGQRGAYATLGALDHILAAVCGKRQRLRPPDARVQEVLAQVHASLPDKPPLAALAGRVGLSEDRLSHLFVETLGLSLRSYAVWLRYRLAVAQLPCSASLTELATACGFADAAHMTRTFVAFFGFSPSRLRRSGFLQDWTRVE